MTENAPPGLPCPSNRRKLAAEACPSPLTHWQVKSSSFEIDPYRLHYRLNA